jgi:phage baseplate assembly protein W
MADDILGVDIRLEDGALLVNSTGDIQWIKDIENLEQALRHRIHTRIGSLRYHPEYGSNIPAMVSRPNTDVLRGMMYVEIVKICEDEPRIDKILNLTVTAPTESEVVIELEVTVINTSTPLNLILKVTL